MLASVIIKRGFGLTVCSHNFILISICVPFMCVCLQGIVIGNMTAAQVHSEEFTKNPEVKKEDLEELKSWLMTQEHLPPISGTVL